LVVAALIYPSGENSSAPAPSHRGLNVFKIIPARAKGLLSKWLNGAPEGFLLYAIASRIFAKKAKSFHAKPPGR